MKKKCWPTLIIALLLVAYWCHLAAAYELKVKAWIDGESQLVIQKNTVYWHNLSWSAPGYEAQAKPLPTYLTTAQMGTVAWHPTSWSNGTLGDTTSASFTKMKLPLAAAGQTVKVTPISVRGNLTIAQQPTVANNYTLILDFDDTSLGGADWYEVSLEFIPGKILSWTDLGFLPGQTSSTVRALNSKGQATGGSGGRAFFWDPKVGQMEDLNAPPDSIQSYGVAINSKGQVAGKVQINAISYPVFWDPKVGLMQDIGTLGGNWCILLRRSMNDKGQVCGWSEVTPGGAIHAFLWDIKNGLKDLGDQPGWTNSVAVAINNKGQICGTAYTPDGERAILWDPKTGHQDLGTLPGGSYSRASAINSKGQVVGTADTGGHDHAFFWDPKINEGKIQDLGTLPGGIMSVAMFINSKGQVVGRANTADLKMHAFFWDPKVGQILDMGNMGESNNIWPQAINNKGQVVGYAEFSGGLEAHAFFWDPKVGEMQDLGTPLGGPLNNAYDINTKGQIAGDITDPEGLTNRISYGGIWSR
jgi:probable HAF family extracellular repeat protein